MAKSKLLQANGLAGVSETKLLLDAYFGDGGFADGSYLEPHKRERAENFEARKAKCYYLNYIAPVVDSHIDPVFKTEAKRDYAAGDQLFDVFMDDIDKAGASIEDFMREAALLAKLTGVCFVVVDNDRLQPGPDGATPASITVAEAVEKRQLPYAFVVTRDKVKKWKLDKRGGLIEFSYVEDEGESSEQDPTAKPRERGWTTTEWYVKDETGKKIESGVNALGRVPVIPFHGRRVRNRFMVKSQFYSCARANANIFNLCSELDQIITDVTFPILKYPQKNLAELTIGTGNAIGWDGTANSGGPSYIAPPSEPAKVIMEQIDRLIKEIYRMATLSNVMGVEQKASGVAKEWDFERTSEVLAALAAGCERVESEIVELYELWTNSKVNYEVQYPEEFGIKDKTEAVEQADKALDLGIGGEFDRQVKKGVAAALFQHIEDDEYDLVMNEIEAAESEARQPVSLFPAGGTSLTGQKPAEQQAAGGQQTTPPAKKPEE